MPPQVSKEAFAVALQELGMDPDIYRGQKLSLRGMSELYEMDEDLILEAIELRHIAAHYDYLNDTIWVDALDAAHFFYCLKNEAHLYSTADR
ncbi:hypothetical protein E3A20_08440 [Planctomyces bekefii]|uniref:Uncharacterized protein n=1 Tax=Planctomyces bekefii TaxID=1653850 RepID=A0A5C6M5L9_9PLAN|nr:hypothetical protein E3A20_08440 [Planctomyces bekefii]